MEHHLAKHCEYGNLREQMILDRIVVGILDSTLSERLHLDPEPKIDKAKNLVRQRETVHEQQQFLSRKPTEAGTMVEAISKSSEVNNLTENHPEVLHNHQVDHLNKGDNKYAPIVEGDLILGKLVLLKMQLVISVTKKDILAQYATQSQFQTFQKSLILSLI